MLRIVMDLRIDTGGVDGMGCVTCSLKNQNVGTVVMKVIVSAAGACNLQHYTVYFLPRHYSTPMNNVADNIIADTYQDRL